MSNYRSDNRKTLLKIALALEGHGSANRLCLRLSTDSSNLYHYADLTKKSVWRVAIIDNYIEEQFSKNYGLLSFAVKLGGNCGHNESFASADVLRESVRR